MRQIGLAVLLTLSLVWVPLPTDAVGQQSANVARIGYLSLEASPALYLGALRDGLRRLGYLDGGNIVIESRLAEGRTERLAPLASELVALKLDAIVGTTQTSKKHARVPRWL